jgi:hypothetical protein
LGDYDYTVSYAHFERVKKTNLGLSRYSARSFDVLSVTSLLGLVSLVDRLFLCDETERLLPLLSGVESLLPRFSGDLDKEVEYSLFRTSLSGRYESVQDLSGFWSSIGEYLLVAARRGGGDLSGMYRSVSLRVGERGIYLSVSRLGERESAR